MEKASLDGIVYAAEAASRVPGLCCREICEHLCGSSAVTVHKGVAHTGGGSVEAAGLELGSNRMNIIRVLKFHVYRMRARSWGGGGCGWSIV